jgi:hypothetical protein
MTDTSGKTVRLFLVDGTPTGLITAEIMNWTGHVLVLPRSRLAEALTREEAGRTGVYLLVGDDPDQPLKSRIYIGEGDNVRTRIAQHAQDQTKDFWSRACLITSKDQNLTKAHVRFLESRLIQIAKSADRATIANSTGPMFKLLPESDIADMEFFLVQLQVILPVIGVDALRKPPTKAPTKISKVDVSEGANPDVIAHSPDDLLELELDSPKLKVKAQAIEKDGEITVLSGSLAVPPRNVGPNGYRPLRDQLIKDGHLKPGPTGSLYVFTQDVTFSSPSAAAAVIYDRSSNGRDAWKVKKTGQTLGQWQDAQVQKIVGSLPKDADR